jgi:hypothetical protein
MSLEKKRDYDRVAEILVEALALSDAIEGADLLTYLITLSLMEADQDYRKHEYFREHPQRARQVAGLGFNQGTTLSPATVEMRRD